MPDRFPAYRYARGFLLSAELMCVALEEAGLHPDLVSEEDGRARGVPRTVGSPRDTRDPGADGAARG